jgi:hypothetical protein
MNCARTLLVALRIQAWIVVDTIGEVISEVGSLSRLIQGIAKMVSGTRCPFIAIINASLEAKYQNVVVIIARGSTSQMPTGGPCPFLPLEASVKQHRHRVWSGNRRVPGLIFKIYQNMRLLTFIKSLVQKKRTLILVEKYTGNKSNTTRIILSLTI